MAKKADMTLLREGIEVWNKWREANQEIAPDLSGADLRAANLRHANLSSADLSLTNLTGVQLLETDLKHANLLKARLVGAELTSTNLYRADLTGADLSHSKIIGVDFTAAHVFKANFYGCILALSRFSNIDLSLVEGLETIEHIGPSSIGIDTIYASGGNIPEHFLRGTGVPEAFIAQLPYLVSSMSPVEFYSCFISYSHQDTAFARRLHDALQGKGIRCWLDEHQLLPGDDIYHQVDRGIRLWDKMLLCCSENSLKSWWVDNEIGTAFEKEQQLMKEREAKAQVLVPLNLDGYLFSDKWKSGYQAQVRRRLAADFTATSDAGKFDEQVERLIKALRADEGAREKPPKQRL